MKRPHSFVFLIEYQGGAVAIAVHYQGVNRIQRSGNASTRINQRIYFAVRMNLYRDDMGSHINMDYV
jgi:hypothetical protein